MQLSGKLVVISGASSGAGAATATEMAQRGAKVIILARRAELLKKVSDEITQNGGQVAMYAVDLADPRATQEVADRILKEHGVPDVLVNNAGAGTFRSVLETTPEEVVSMMAVPFFGAFYLTRAFLADMLKRNSGRIVNLTSPAGFAPFPHSTGYSVARWAMRGFAEALRADLYGTGIGVTLITPGHIKDSDYWQSNIDSEARIPGISKLMRSLTSKEVGKTIVRAVEREKETVFYPGMLHFISVLLRLFPKTVSRMVHTTGYKEKK
jgi:short-subunit dehydrogenase